MILRSYAHKIVQPLTLYSTPIMKKEDIKATKPFGLTEGMVPVDKARLRQTGNGGGIRFHVGDIIDFPPFEDLEIYTTSFKDKDGKEHEYELVKVGFNNKVKLIPVASFRRDKNGVDASAEKYSAQTELSRDLQMCTDDYARMTILCGHTVKVKDMFNGREFRYENGSRVDYNDGDVKTFKTRQWPVFEMVD